MDVTFSDIYSQLLNYDETVQIEAKTASDVGKSIRETVSAFANEPDAGGGYFLLGVRMDESRLFPQYEVVGIEEPDKVQRELASLCSSDMNVAIRPEILIETYDSKTVILVFIPEAAPSDKPVYITSQGLPRGAFRRIGSTDQHCTEDDVASLHQERTQRSYDETVVEGTTLADVDEDAVKEYRRLRASERPEAEELKLDDRDLLFALHALSEKGGKDRLTVAGMVLFGRSMSLRRYMPSARVDYIRIPGREWVSDPDRRYETIERLGPLVLVASRVVSDVLDDIPTAFSLGEDDHRKDVPLIPRKVIREAVVNALMHRSYRRCEPIQIIKYANRVELRNPGVSLVSDEKLGQPGSFARNEKIATVFHDIGLAEMKGTGIKVMRESMKDVNLSVPLFESDREADKFSAVLLTHHFFSPDDLEWLKGFADCDLSPEDAKAMILVRETGAINNAVFREVSGHDSHQAGLRLAVLRDKDLLEKKGNGRATYYVLGKRTIVTPEELAASIEESTPTGSSPDLPKPRELNSLDLPKPSESRASVDVDSEEQLAEMPSGLVDLLRSIGKRTDSEILQTLVLRLCAWRNLTSKEIAGHIGRSQDYLTTSVIKPAQKGGLLDYVEKSTPHHPKQKYVTSQNGIKFLLAKGISLHD